MDQEVIGTNATAVIPSGFSDLSNWVTASATVALAFLTLALVWATLKMVRAGSQPHVIANIESNQWSLRHMDVVIANTGNAPAYDVVVDIDPKIPLSDSKGDVPFPFSKISIIRPGQSLVSFATDWKKIKGELYTFQIAWSRRPGGRKEKLSYSLDMNNLEGISHLGRENPMIQVAEQIKHLREDWKAVALGQRRLEINIHDQEDRDDERARREEMIAEMREEAQKEPSE
jgi:hypothetical protein